jgi:ATPase subunit of ABC transporter with duplicated ATPase domains
MITIDQVSKSIAGRTLFENVSVTFNEGFRYGLTGPNGAGKSTLLSIILGFQSPDSGSVVLPQKVGYLKQNIEDFHNHKVIDCVIMGNPRLWDAFTERDTLYEGEMTDKVGFRLGELEEIIAEEDGYSAEADAEMLLTGMGVEASMHEQTMKEIPTDLQFRVLLCQALFGSPQALLLDEPTNHLDLESISWLEGFLKKYSGALIVVSHDKHFLNTITTHIADIDYETLIVYPGNYDAMLLAKTSMRQGVESDIKAKEKKISQLKEFVQKFQSGTRASQVQSRLKEIRKLEPQELKQSNIQRPYIRFTPPTKQSGQVALSAENLQKSFDGIPVIKNFSVEILRGEKVGVIGNNGKGKTTLLKLLAGLIKPDAGKVTTGHQAELGYFPQNHQEVLDLSSDRNLFDYLKECKNAAYDQDIRGVLGKMLFSGDDAFKQIRALSGGERARLLIAKLMLTEPNTIILDEPNNHLDLEAVSALGWGLEEFKGTAVIASHDRDLISNFAKKLIIFEGDEMIVYDGTLEEYLACKT